MEANNFAILGNRWPVQVRCMKQGPQSRCTGTTQRDGMGREVGGGLGCGHMDTRGWSMSMFGKTSSAFQWRGGGDLGWPYFSPALLRPVVKNPPANAGDVRDESLMPGSGRPPGGGHSNPHQCSCLENPMGRGACWATIHGVAKSQTRLSDWTHKTLVTYLEKSHFTFFS